MIKLLKNISFNLSTLGKTLLRNRNKQIYYCNVETFDKGKMRSLKRN